MEKTRQYQLNQWAAEDRILREDFNRDNANVEAGLVALGERVTAEEAARQAAVSAEQSAREQAVTSAKSQLDAAKADKTALAALQAQVDAMPFVKLREVTTSAAAVQVDVSMSGIDLSQYAYVLVVPRLSSGSSTIYLRLNGISDAYYFREASSRKYLVFFQSFAKDCNTLIKLMGMGEGITAISEYVAKSGDGFQDYASMDTGSGVFSRVRVYTSVPAKAPTLMNPAWPRLSSPRIPTVRLRLTASTT